MRVRTNGARVALGLIVTLAVIVPVVTLSTPAYASHCGGGGSVDDDGGDVVGECHAVDPGRQGSGTVVEAWNRNCADAAGPYQDGDEVEWLQTDQLTEGDVLHLGLDPTGEYWWWGVFCYRDGVLVYSYEYAVEVTPPVPVDVIRDRASARIEPPAPSPSSSPPLARQTFVNVATWLWVDEAYWQPIEVSETQGLVTVVVRATPVQAEWVMGDGGSLTCYSAGVEWRSGLAEDATDCSYTYEHSSYGRPEGRFQASVTVVWEFEWWINGAYQGVFGAVDSSSPFEVAVGEIQGVETEG